MMVRFVLWTVVCTVANPEGTLLTLDGLMRLVERRVRRVREIGDGETSVGERGEEGGDRPSVRQDNGAAGRNCGEEGLGME
jgi:hypothetical protein